WRQCRDRARQSACLLFQDRPIDRPRSNYAAMARPYYFVSYLTPVSSVCLSIGDSGHNQRTALAASMQHHEEATSPQILKTEFMQRVLCCQESAVAQASLLAHVPKTKSGNVNWTSPKSASIDACAAWE